MIFPSIYKAKATNWNGTALTVLVPQVFGEAPIIVTDWVASPSTGMGWVLFQGGNPEFPVWSAGLGSGADIAALQAADVTLDSRLGTVEAQATSLQAADVALDSRLDVLEAQTTAWTALPLAAGWSNYGVGGYQTGQLRKFYDMVQVRGTIKHTAGMNTLVWTFPAGFRPPMSIQIPVRMIGSGGYLDIHALDGTVTLSTDIASTTNTAAVSFNFQFSLTP